MIPQIIHFSLPRESNTLYEYCHSTVKNIHGDWEFMYHYDNDTYEYVGEYLGLCPSGAFRADLIRLEVIYRFGGIYLDSDIHLLRSMNDLLNLDIFFTGDDGIAIGNAAFGAYPKHPLMLKVLEHAINNVDMLSKGVLWGQSQKAFGQYLPWGPLMVTEALLGEEVTVLPKKMFQPLTLGHILNEEQKKTLPMWRPTVASGHLPAPSLDGAYGVHLNYWSWSDSSSWNLRK